MRRRAAGALACAMTGLCTLVASVPLRPALAAAPAFTDVPASFWAAAAIDRLAGLGLLQGMGAGRFDPAGTMTRAQFATLLARLDQAPPTTVGPPFADVEAGAWYAPGVAAASGLGWMSGTAPATFAPAALVTRAMAAVAVVRYLGMNHVAADLAGTSLPYADAADVPAYAHGSAVVSLDLGVLVGSGGRLLPTQPLTRAQAATLILRLQGVTTAQLQAEGDQVASYVHVQVVAGAVGPGGATDATAYAHDATGYIVPADFTWSARGAAVQPGVGSRYEGRARVTAPGPGEATVTATVTDAKVSAGARVQVEEAATLEVSGLPPAVLATATLPLLLRVLTPAGAVDAAADGTVVTAVVTPTTGTPLTAVVTATTGTPLTATATPTTGTPLTATATLHGGSTTLTLPVLPVGAYTLTLAAPGLPPVDAPLTSVAAPLGALQLTASDGRGVPDAGVAVDGQVTAMGAIAWAGAPTPPAPTGDWPLQVAVSGRQAALPALVGESAPPATLHLDVASRALPAGGSGPVAVIGGRATGSGTLSLSVPGGALLAATLPLQVTPTGAFGGVTTPAITTAGQTAAVAVHLPSAGAGGVRVSMEAIDPAGHPLPWVQATTDGGLATVTFRPVRAGRWTFRWYAHGYTPVAAGSLAVTPGVATRLVVDPTPTSLLLPGQRASIGAWAADAYGNAIQGALRLRATVATGAPAGTLATAASATAVPATTLATATPTATLATIAAPAGTLALSPAPLVGPATVATFTAGATPGETTVTFTAAGLPPAAVTFRTVAARADRLAGKGGWVLFPEWKSTGTAALLARAMAEGETHLYIEVATTGDGFYGGRALDDLLYQAHAAGLAVIAWVYAGLEDPAYDTEIARQVATYTTPTGDRPDGIALDLEEVLTPGLLFAYTAAVDAAEGPQGLTIAVLYPPQYGPQTPLQAIAPHVQAIAPMDYWHISEGDDTYDYVYQWVEDSIRLVRGRANAPTLAVEVIAQTYDAFAGGVGRGIYSPSADEVAAAMRAAKEGGAVGVSFYRPSTATAAEAAVMAQAW